MSTLPSPRQSAGGDAPARGSQPAPSRWQLFRGRLTFRRFNAVKSQEPKQPVPVCQARSTAKLSSVQRTGSIGRSATALAAAAHLSAQDAPVLYSPWPSVITNPPIISCGGGGIYFFWMLGVMKYIAGRYDVTQAMLLGASAGGLIAVLTACQVDLDYAVERAYQLSLQHKLWERPLGVVGIWGSIIRTWLDDILPDDAHVRCSSGPVKLVATELPLLRQVYLQDFTSKADLLDACMASAHVPMVLDGRPFTMREGKLYLDGSLQDFIVWDNSPLLKCGGNALILDYSKDKALAAERFDFLKLRLYEEILHMINLGYEYGRRIEEDGTLPRHLHQIRRSQPTPAPSPEAFTP